MSRATAPPRDLIRPCQRLLTPFSALHPRVGAYRPPRCSRPWRSPERSGFACAVKQNTSSHTTSLSSFDAFETTHRPLIRLFRAVYLSRIPRSLKRAHPQEGWGWQKPRWGWLLRQSDLKLSKRFKVQHLNRLGAHGNQIQPTS